MDAWDPERADRAVTGLLPHVDRDVPVPSDPETEVFERSQNALRKAGIA